MFPLYVNLGCLKKIVRTIVSSRVVRATQQKEKEMRKETLEFIRGLFEEALKNEEKKEEGVIMRDETRELLDRLIEEASKEEDTIMKKNKVKEYLEKWAIEKQGEEVPLSPEDKGLVEAVADRVCETKCGNANKNVAKR